MAESSEKDLRGFEAAEVDEVAQRSQNLASVIASLGASWNIVPESPVKPVNLAQEADNGDIRSNEPSPAEDQMNESPAETDEISSEPVRASSSFEEEPSSELNLFLESEPSNASEPIIASESSIGRPACMDEDIAEAIVSQSTDVSAEALPDADSTTITTTTTSLSDNVTLISVVGDHESEDGPTTDASLVFEDSSVAVAEIKRISGSEEQILYEDIGAAMEEERSIGIREIFLDKDLDGDVPALATSVENEQALSCKNNEIDRLEAPTVRIASPLAVLDSAEEKDSTDFDKSVAVTSTEAVDTSTVVDSEPEAAVIPSSQSICRRDLRVLLSKIDLPGLLGIRSRSPNIRMSLDAPTESVSGDAQCGSAASRTAKRRGSLAEGGTLAVRPSKRARSVSLRSSVEEVDEQSTTRQSAGMAEQDDKALAGTDAGNKLAAQVKTESKDIEVDSDIYSVKVEPEVVPGIDQENKTAPDHKVEQLYVVKKEEEEHVDIKNETEIDSNREIEDIASNKVREKTEKEEMGRREQKDGSTSSPALRELRKRDKRGGGSPAQTAQKEEHEEATAGTGDREAKQRVGRRELNMLREEKSGGKIEPASTPKTRQLRAQKDEEQDGGTREMRRRSQKEAGVEATQVAAGSTNKALREKEKAAKPSAEVPKVEEAATSLTRGQEAAEKEMRSRSARKEENDKQAAEAPVSAGGRETRKRTAAAAIEADSEGPSLRHKSAPATPVAGANSGTQKPAQPADPSSKSKSPSKLTLGSPSKSDSSSVVVSLKRQGLLKKGMKGVSERALMEADILKRVHQLKAKGLWTDKKLAKKVEEVKPKAHWDFVIEEMTWLSDVVQKEVKMKKANAKRCAAMVQKHFKDRELAVARAEKAKEAHLRKIAANIAREVRAFWANAQKLFEWQVRQQLEKKRKEALDQHLNYIVDKTEKYSTLLAESLAESANVSGQASRAESVCSGGDIASEPGGDDDREYNPDSGSSDDEETIEQEEKEDEGDRDNKKELQELEEGAEVPLEELLKKYYPDQFGDIAPIKDEKTSKEEKSGGITTTSTPPEEEETGGRRRRKVIDFAAVERKIEEENAMRKAAEEGAVTSEAEVREQAKQEEPREEEEEEKEEGLKSLMEGEDKLEEYASMAAKFQPTGNTLETTTVKTRVPSLLKHTLREYQHIGLDWLVSLYERNLNGILADEMGLGKTIQTIAFLAHLAVDRANWGPHLIVVPTSVMLNWEMEIKKWCPGFKVLVYFGSQKERRMKRVGWTKQNAFHICITSYKLVTQDHSSFRRFKWQYFILDEAQHIKNFKSQRWQLLLNFTSVGRLLLTGTPLQNNLMELWSLMHFLMPHVFESHRDFKEWFSNPLTGMVEGNSEYNDNLIRRLHKVLRPFILRRLKNEVEKQLPKKYAHVIKCPLSKRQRFLYDDFMSRAKTKETLASGNLLSVINVLMQLRKCCNHPNLFEPRPTLSPLIMTPLRCGAPTVPRQVVTCLEYDPFRHIDLACTALCLRHHETTLSAYVAFRADDLKCTPRSMLHPPATAVPPFKCPLQKLRMRIKSQQPPLPRPAVLQLAYPSPVLHLQPSVIGHVIPVRHLSNANHWLWQEGNKLKTPHGYFQIAQRPWQDLSSVAAASQLDDESDNMLAGSYWCPPKKMAKLEVDPEIKAEIKEEEQSSNNNNNSHAEERGEVGWDDEVEEDEEVKKKKTPVTIKVRHAKGIYSLSLFADSGLPTSSPSKLTSAGQWAAKRRREATKAALNMPSLKAAAERYVIQRRRRNLEVNNRRVEQMPMLGAELVAACQEASLVPSGLLRSGLEQLTCHSRRSRGADLELIDCYPRHSLVQTLPEVLARLEPILDRFLQYVPAAWTSSGDTWFSGGGGAASAVAAAQKAAVMRYPGDRIQTRFLLQTPDTRLIQYDCGKLQILANLLRDLQSGGHRVLIFTQMTRMLDILEAFLNYHGYVYMRLDGSTKVEMRQALMERFNNNPKYFCFILSTRSGGVGINLTGADTVVFYDSDWNPTMDAQAQDRCHRIGQTRDVHIYRLVSERTVEENILKKANQKRILGDIAIEGGNFTTAFFKKQTIHDLFAAGGGEEVSHEEEDRLDEAAPTAKKSIGAFESALATAEDDSDRQATSVARAEEQNLDEADFNDQEDEDQFAGVLAELISVERYALRQMKEQEQDWARGQLLIAEAEIQARKEEFDADKLDELTQEIRAEMGEETTDEDDNASDDEDEDTEDDDQEEGDYAPDASSSDDETTIARDEREVDDKVGNNPANEIHMLENEAEVPIEELLRMYYPDQLKNMLEIEVDMEEATTTVAIVGDLDAATTEEADAAVAERKKTRSRGAVEINLWNLGTKKN